MEWRQRGEVAFTDGRKLTRELFGLFLLFWALLVLLSLLTFNVNDPSLNHVVSKNEIISNKAGLLGAYLSGFLNDVFGVASFIWPLVFAALGAAYISTVYELLWWRWGGYFLLTLCLLSAGAAWDFGIGDVRGGGMVGRALYENTRLALSPGGSALMWIFVLLVATQLAFDLSWMSLSKRAFEYCRKRWLSDDMPMLRLPRLKVRCPAFVQRLRSKFMEPPTSTAALPEVLVELPDSGKTLADDDIFAEVHPVGGTLGDDVSRSVAEIPAREAETAPQHAISGVATATAVPSSTSGGGNTAPAKSASPAQEGKPGLGAVLRQMVGGAKAKVPLPSFDLLTAAKEPSKSGMEDMEAKGKTLMACLADFDIQGELVRITPGPVVTMFEVRPKAGIRVSRISNLSDDMALRLKALAVRIQAPIPGSNTVGIEIPNTQRATVSFRALLESDTFRKGSGPLSMALGKDISGQPFVADLSRMPHLLVAGATGAGKSVCLNSILLSLLYTTRPEDMKLLLVDPKRIEMAVYADLPHLVHPVVTEMNQAKTALDWAVHEMDQRYTAMSRLGVRNIAGYNQKLEAFGANLPQDMADLERMPYLVIIIDELADLMLTAAREVETSIVRLAQLARASGIHMILATQRPSVDVVTGLIKANFPCRISFQVTSKHDSRTILDTVGAEHLLGKGDMLFKPSGGRLQRLHGPFVSDEEVVAVVNYWKRQLPPGYRVDFFDWGNEAVGGGVGGGGDVSQDPLYAEVLGFVDEQGRASISLIQRRFQIGFNRAARLVEQLERDGVIGPADGSKPRAVLRNK